MIDFSAWTTYANGLKNCTPTTYKVPNPRQLSQNMSFWIFGWMIGKCHVKVTSPSVNTDCYFQSNDLKTMSQSIAAALTGEDDKAIIDALGPIAESPCGS